MWKRRRGDRYGARRGCDFQCELDHDAVGAANHAEEGGRRLDAVVRHHDWNLTQRFESAGTVSRSVDIESHRVLSSREPQCTGGAERLSVPLIGAEDAECRKDESV